MFQKTVQLLLALTSLLSLCGCSYISSIDDDTTGCNETYDISYQLHAVINTNYQITEQMPDDGDATLRESLTDLLNPLLHPTSYSTQLLFVNAADGSFESSAQTIEGDEKVLALTLCPGSYRHLAVSGTDKVAALLVDTTNINKMGVVQPSGDTIIAQQQPLLSARQDITITGNSNEDIHVRLYPANAAVAVVATQPETIKDVQMFITDLASSFTINDSTYHFEEDALLRTSVSDGPKEHEKIYHALTFPSRDVASRANGDAARTDGTIWRVIVLATCSDNSVTRSVLSVQRPLKAGDVRVIRISIANNGAVTTSTAGVGASVTLDWNKGGEYHPNI
ncbi:MAG: FimB/Mfa2 family fimbrial subunit [Prevotella sp.]|nr:FimB/Mfa2 family fimbrial subunit [Prevotella sp.]